MSQTFPQEKQSFVVKMVFNGTAYYKSQDFFNTSTNPLSDKRHNWRETS